jgi:hypothetical protein
MEEGCATCTSKGGGTVRGLFIFSQIAAAILQQPGSFKDLTERPDHAQARVSHLGKY